MQHSRLLRSPEFFSEEQATTVTISNGSLIYIEINLIIDPYGHPIEKVEKKLNTPILYSYF